MKIELNQNEVDFILQVLGELPTKTGAYVLLANIDQQVKAQLPPTPPQEA